ncbi:UNVERIFIED_CONTAM: hypothetical protein K2H54_058907 [Gekko kuhli]
MEWLWKRAGGVQVRNGSGLRLLRAVHGGVRGGQARQGLAEMAVVPSREHSQRTMSTCYAAFAGAFVPPGLASPRPANGLRGWVVMWPGGPRAGWRQRFPVSHQGRQPALIM